jgi:hypothetical protein
MGSMNDWPEFTMRTETGEESSWSRYANDPVFASLYTVGRPIELDYVVQQHRPHSFDTGAETRYPLKSASMKTPNQSRWSQPLAAALKG